MLINKDTWPSLRDSSTLCLIQELTVGLLQIPQEIQQLVSDQEWRYLRTFHAVKEFIYSYDAHSTFELSPRTSYSAGTCSNLKIQGRGFLTTIPHLPQQIETSVLFKWNRRSLHLVPTALRFSTTTTTPTIKKNTCILRWLDFTSLWLTTHRDRALQIARPWLSD